MVTWKETTATAGLVATAITVTGILAESNPVGVSAVAAVSIALVMALGATARQLRRCLDRRS